MVCISSEPLPKALSMCYISTFTQTQMVVATIGVQLDYNIVTYTMLRLMHVWHCMNSPKR